MPVKGCRNKQQRLCFGCRLLSDRHAFCWEILRSGDFAQGVCPYLQFGRRFHPQQQSTVPKNRGTPHNYGTFPRNPRIPERSVP